MYFRVTKHRIEEIVGSAAYQKETVTYEDIENQEWVEPQWGGEEPNKGKQLWSEAAPRGIGCDSYAYSGYAMRVQLETIYVCFIFSAHQWRQLGGGASPSPQDSHQFV